MISPITLSRGLEIAKKMTPKNKRANHWYEWPVADLIQQIGDIQVKDVTSEQLDEWLNTLHKRDHHRAPGRKLSVWTIDSYGRAIRAYFTKLVEAEHLEQSPCKYRLPRLPKKQKLDIPTNDIEKMVQWSEHNVRDHAIVLILCDSGCRVGELVSIQVAGVKLEEHKPGLWRGRALVHGKMNKRRWIYFSHDAVLALQRYMRVRPHDAPDDLWLSTKGGVLSTSGVYQTLKRIGKLAGVKRFNPHAFRHALAKRLVAANAPN
jgi:integrase/recombinase XerD